MAVTGSEYEGVLEHSRRQLPANGLLQSGYKRHTFNCGPYTMLALSIILENPMLPSARILVVDDDPDIGLLIQDYLQQFNLACTPVFRWRGHARGHG